MLNTLTQRFRLRSVLAALLMLGLALQPVLAAAGEFHELAHDPSGQHAGLASDSDSSDPGGESSGASDEDPVLHVLLQCAHCCGSGAAVVPVARFVADARPLDNAMPVGSLAYPGTPLTAPFKPPIQA